MMPEFLYHGTSTGYLDQILRDGLDPQSSYKGYLCYADDLAISAWHAECMAVSDEAHLDVQCMPVIFKINQNRFSRRKFCLEQNFIDPGPSAGRACENGLPERDWTWQALLAFAGAVGYRKLLRVSAADILQALP